MIIPVEVIEAQGTKSEVRVYNMLMQCTVETGSIATGFALLERVEASGLPTSGEGCYRLFRTLLEACRAVDDAADASRVQAAIERQNLIALAPEATLTGLFGPSKRVNRGLRGLEDVF